jgi:cell division protein ZapE
MPPFDPSIPISAAPSPADAPLVADTPGLQAAYRALIGRGDLVFCPAQALAVEKLQGLSRALLRYNPNTKSGGWRARFGLAARPEENPPPQGLYLYGGVGRGKSMLMDLFHGATPIAAKRRVHFHAFMLEVHDRIFRQGRLEKGDPIPPVAKSIADAVTLLCFDEFHVTDIADAMILGRLFKALFDQGVVVVATSNRPPDDLYLDGLQRERFLPFIDLLKDKLDVLAVDGARDYRLRRIAQSPIYHCPLDQAAAAALAAAFRDLTDGAAAAPAILPLKGRSLVVPRAARGVAWFSFAELCGEARGAVDYLALCESFHTLILEGIPALGPEQRNEARRFNTLIDTIYEARLTLVASAAVPPEKLYTEGDGAFEFARTVSRLMEMQTSDYVQGRRLPPT